MSLEVGSLTHSLILKTGNNYFGFCRCHLVLTSRSGEWDHDGNEICKLRRRRNISIKSLNEWRRVWFLYANEGKLKSWTNIQ